MLSLPPKNHISVGPGVPILSPGPKTRPSRPAVPASSSLHPKVQQVSAPQQQPSVTNGKAHLMEKGWNHQRRHWEVCIKTTEHIQKSSKWLGTGRSAGRGWFCSPMEGHQQSHRQSTCPRRPFHSKAAAFSWRGAAWGNDDSAIKASTRRQETQVR